jgi:RimJ/RimL family protein N-acetyltransferase
MPRRRQWFAFSDLSPVAQTPQDPAPKPAGWFAQLGLLGFGLVAVVEPNRSWGTGLPTPCHEARVAEQRSSPLLSLAIRPPQVRGHGGGNRSTQPGRAGEPRKFHSVPGTRIKEVDVLSLEKTLVTSRLEVRPPSEPDRARFVELFCNDDFMIFSGQALTAEAAHRRFDHMLVMCEVVPFAKRPVVERASGLVIGYTGIDYFNFEGEERLEWGYRLVPESRGLGYATEASRALLACARETFSGELLAIINTANHASQNVCRKLDFVFLKQALVGEDIANFYTLAIGDIGR